jgi:peptidoglycan/LPS O-acetylase OafA/YrhL
MIAYLQTYSLFPLHFAINPVTWTLSYEIFFYIVFALLIISKRLIVIPVLILLVSFYNIFINQSGSELTYFNFIFSGYNFEFVLGCLIFQFYDKVQLSKALSLILLTIAISIIIYFGYEVSDVDSFQRVLTFGLPSGLILLTLLNLEKDGVISFPKIFLMLGDASYALYLIHFPMMLLMNKIPQMLGYKFTATQEINYSYLIIISIVITSFFVHKWIEKPIAKFILK